MIAVLKSQISSMQFPSQKPRLFGNLSKNNLPPLITFCKPHKKSIATLAKHHALPGILAAGRPHPRHLSLFCWFDGSASEVAKEFTLQSHQGDNRSSNLHVFLHRKLEVPFVVQGWAKVKIKKYIQCHLKVCTRYLQKLTKTGMYIYIFTRNQSYHQKPP